MRFKSFIALIAVALFFVSCDDTTSTLGVDMMPGTDFVTKKFQTYEVATESYEVGDSVLARSSVCYLGRYTDPETGTTVKSDFLAQFHCNDSFSLPESIRGDSCVSVELKLFVKEFVGDSLATFKLSVYELDNDLDNDVDYYTNIKPENYLKRDAKPIATKWFTLSDRTIPDSERWQRDYNNNITVALPNSFGKAIIDDYRKNPHHYKGAGNWLKSGMPGSKGMYFKLENGDGAMAYIDVIQYRLNFVYHDDYYDTDTLGLAQLAATEEVVLATHFENSGLDKLMDDKSSTYMKCPAGVFTLATLPVGNINVNDTINSAKISFTRYNDKVTDTQFSLAIPQTVLMVRLDDYLNGFFETYKVNDGRESYIASFNNSTNSYEFGNVARLIATMLKEKANGTATVNYDKVLIVPVNVTKDSSGKVVKIDHDFSMSSCRLVGGNTGGVNMEVIYSAFNTK